MNNINDCQAIQNNILVTWDMDANAIYWGKLVTEKTVIKTNNLIEDASNKDSTGTESEEMIENHGILINH